LIIIPLQSLRFDTLSIALSYKDSFYCEWLILLLIYFGKQKTTLSRPLEHGMSVSPLISWPRDSQGDKLIELCLSDNKVPTNSSLKFMLMTLFLELLWTLLPMSSLRT
jgi:hypothetical protein